jgi:hypothetical protein
MFHGGIEIAQGLRFNALSGVNEEEDPFAGSKRPGNLVGKIDMSRRVDKVQFVFYAVLADIGQINGLTLDRNATFALDIHIVQYLVPKLSVLNEMRVLNETIGKC